MIPKTSAVFVLAALLGVPSLSLLGCNLGPGDGNRDDDDASDDDDSVGDDDDGTESPPVDASIADLTSGGIDDGQAVHVEGGVVTTPIWVDGEDGAYFWIQEGSGPGSGIVVFTYPDIAETLIDAIDAGDEVTIDGEYREPFGFGEILVDSADDVVFESQGEIPIPHVVAASEIEGGFADTSLLGVLIEVDGTTVGAGPSWDNYYVWDADGALVDDVFYYADVESGYEIQSLVGVLHLNFGDATLFPRWDDDVLFSYPGCDDAWTGTDNLPSINCRTVSEGTELQVDGLVVVSPEPWYGGAFYVQDPAGGPFSGALVYSFDKSMSLPDIGTVVNVHAEYSEYRGNTELLVEDAADVEDSGTTAELVATELDDACALDESLEGMLVSVAELVVDEQDGTASDWGYYEVDGCPNVHVGSEFFMETEEFQTATGGAGTILGLVGVVSDRYEILSVNPRDADDWTSWGE